MCYSLTAFSQLNIDRRLSVGFAGYFQISGLMFYISEDRKWCFISTLQFYILALFTVNTWLIHTQVLRNSFCLFYKFNSFMNAWLTVNASAITLVITNNHKYGQTQQSKWNPWTGTPLLVWLTHGTSYCKSYSFDFYAAALILLLYFMHI